MLLGGEPDRRRGGGAWLFPDDRSPHAEFLASRGEGMHHLAFLVADFDEQLAEARRIDPEADLLIDGTGPGNPVRWVYLNGGAAHGAVTDEGG